MKALLILLAVCLSTAYTASIQNDRGSSEFKSREGDFLYTVALTMKKNNKLVRLCGGAQLSRDWFLTAAECFYKTTADTMALTYGPEYNTADFITILSHMKHTPLVIHERYNDNTKANNIALVKCASCGRLGNEKTPRVPSLKDVNESSSRKPAILTAVLNNDPSTSIYNYGAYYQKTELVSPFWCKLSYLLSVGKEHMCASSKNGNLPENAVGAPLVTNGESEGSFNLVGIATSIYPWTDRISLPMVFTRVAPYRDWIQNVTSISV